jgi:two-component system alkaline phosphatase synthesis response regulator PhoP
MPREHVLIIEDEEDIQEILRYNLEKEGYQVTGAGSGEEGLGKVRADLPDIVLLDLMLPGVDGLEVCKALRRDHRTENIPVIMITVKGDESDIVTGLELGADDYITKPFSPKVVIARIRAVLRRKAMQPRDKDAVIKVDDIVIDPVRHRVTVKGKPLELTYTEFSILAHLARHPGWVFTRYQIVDAVRGMDYPVSDRSVDVQIVGLRKKLASAGEYIETVRGVGYRFRE